MSLNVSRSSLPTCLAVLRAVHAEAEQRGAGVIFLGDFWHEKGILRTEALNAVLLELRQWRVPMLALPAFSAVLEMVWALAFCNRTNTSSGIPWSAITPLFMTTK